MSKKLENKVFIITGGASGMGKATTEKFVKEGAFIVSVDKNPDVLNVWADNDNVTPLVVDITNLNDINHMMDVVKETYGHLDGICNIAGINDLCYPMDATDDDRWDRVLDIDLKAPFRIIRAAAPLLKENGGGSIVNIGSYAALRGNHGPSYSAAKAGLQGLTKSVAFEYGKHQIRCNIVHPGAVDTSIARSSGGNYHEAQQILLKLCSGMPVNYWGGQKELGVIANTCAFLCSDDAFWINGAVISVDGGMAVC